MQTVTCKTVFLRTKSKLELASGQTIRTRHRYWCQLSCESFQHDDVSSYYKPNTRSYVHSIALPVAFPFQAVRWPPI